MKATLADLLGEPVHIFRDAHEMRGFILRIRGQIIWIDVPIAGVYRFFRRSPFARARGLEGCGLSRAQGWRIRSDALSMIPAHQPRPRRSQTAIDPRAYA